MKWKLLMVEIVCALIVGACGGPRSYPSTQAEAPVADVGRRHQMAAEALGYQAPAEEPAVTGKVTSPSDASGGTGLDLLTQSAPDRYLIKNATVIIETDDARAATDQLTAALAQVNGYVSGLNETVNAFGKRTVVMQIRIPSDQFDHSMLQVESLGKVLNKQVTTEDVTEQFVDTDARVRNLKRTEERLLEHLDRAGVLEDVLRVEQELTRTREQIERLEGQLRFLGNRVSYSTINITLQEAARTEPIVPAETYSTGKVFSEAVRSLVGFAQRIWTRVIWIVVWSPVWIVPALILLVMYRRWRKRQAA